MFAIITVLLLFLTACGSELDKPYENEKIKREESESSRADTSAELDLLKKMWSQSVRTNNYIWAWVINTPDHRYEEARALCKSFGFDFPSAGMLAEADANAELFEQTTSVGGGSMYYILDDLGSKGFVIMCAKSSK